LAIGNINVMLVDDHAVVRMGFRLLLEGSPDIRVVAESESGEEACRKYPEVKPDVVVMDISMPGIGGLEAIDRILAREPAARILVLSAHEDAMHARRVLKAGAAGYLTKRSAAEALMQAIRQGLPFAGKGPVGRGYCRGDVAESPHHRYAPVQHKTKARRIEFGRVGHHRNSCRPYRSLNLLKIYNI